MHSRLPMGTIIGRDDDSVRVDRMLWEEGVRLVTLTGPGGVGKTRLALDVAERADARPGSTTYWVELGTIRDPCQILPTIASALRLSLDSDLPLEDRIVDVLEASDCLLVLDNFEQVVDAATDLLPLLRRCPSLHLLVTSRVPLQITFEREVPIEPLPHPRAIELFVERARERVPRFGLTHDTMPQVKTICCRLDGIPLAIELAAPRLAVLSLHDLTDRIDRALTVLAESPRDRPERQHTMRSTIAWSYNLLTDDEKALFRLIASFSDGVRLFMLEAVVRDPRLGFSVEDVPHARLLERLAALIQHNLLRVVPGEGNQGTRYRMFETIREFGLEQLAAHQELGDILRARAHAAVGVLQSTREKLFRPGAPDLIAELDAERRNLRDLLQWSLDADEGGIGLTIANAIGSFWIMHGHYREGGDWLDQLLPAATDANPSERALGYARLGWLRMLQGDLDRGEAALTTAITLGTDSDAPLTTAVAQQALSRVYLHRGDVQEALRISQVAGSTLDTLMETTPIATHFASIGYLHRSEIYLWKGDLVMARALVERALRMQQEGGFGWAEGDSHRVMGHVERREGNLDAAMHHYAMSLTLARDHGDPRMMAATVASIGYVCALRGDPANSAVALGISDELRRRGGTNKLTWDADTYDRAVRLATDLLGETEFQSKWTTGSQMGLDQALEFATSLVQNPDPLEPAGKNSPADGPNLTQREREVLRLVVDGLSDREIADLMSLSPRTVGGHVSNLLVKLDATSRTAAAVQAVRLGLDR